VLVLGIDTSGRQGSVALLRAQGEELLGLELAALSGGQYSERLVPTIAELLVRHGCERSSIGMIAVASGPGSFTGLRIAIATVKGLAEAFDTPVVAVSVLEAVAIASGMDGRVIAALDAQRTEVFFGDYTVGDDVSSKSRQGRMNREGISSFGDFASLLAASDPGQKIFTPDDGLAGRLREAGFEAELLARPTAESYGRIGHGKFLAGVRADVATLDANYLRRSDAEIFVAPKPGTARR
jgi:tRNA threonylcarbamoyladenosine biosynthesis protein TsaB